MFLEYIKLSNKSIIPGAVALGDHIYISAQLPVNKEGVLSGLTIEEQTEQCLTNINHILQEKNLDLSYIIKMSIHLKDMSQYDRMVHTLAESMSESVPVISCIGVYDLPYNALVQISAYAMDTRTLQMLCATEEDSDCDGEVCCCKK